MDILGKKPQIVARPEDLIWDEFRCHVREPLEILEVLTGHILPTLSLLPDLS